MIEIIKRLPPVKTVLAISFLLLQTGCALYLPYLTAGIVDWGILQGDISFIWQQGGIMLAFTCLSLVGALLNMYIAGTISFELGMKLRSEIFVKALDFSQAEYDKFGTSGLITRNTNDVTQVQTVVEMFLKFLILSPLYLIGGIYLTAKLNSALALPFITVIPFMTLAALVIYRFATPLYSKMQRLLDRLNLLFREGVTGVRVIRAFAKENEDYKKYEETNREYTRTSIAAGTIMSIFIPLITLILNLATLAIVGIGGWRADGGGMEVGAIMAAVTYSAQILMGFSLLTNVILTLPRGQVSAKRIYEVLETSVSIKSPVKPETLKDISLAFEEVDFRYPGALRQTLNGISFKLEKGQTLAVVGGTGDGKSTILSLISRFHDVENGSIKIGGIDIRNMALWDLRSKVSYTPQKSALMMGTIRSNLLISKPEATDVELWAALDAACATEFVLSLAHGLDNVVEKGGANFSGGQRQRLCIARTILKEADIYLFDDSFSALDFKTDSLVRTAIKKQLQDKLVIIVAQRVGTIAQADAIAVLDSGRLAGFGTHQELKDSNGVYQEIIKSQDYKEVVA